MEKQTHKGYPYKTSKEQRQKRRQYYETNKDWILAAQRENYLQNADYLKRLRAKRKRMVFDHYGNICACCNELEPKFLTIDHVNNDGHKERKVRGGGRSDTIIYNIIRQGFPKTYQVLCMNCNLGKSRNNGQCPHNYLSH